jgi:N-acetylglucosaminyl-diphospho-decaprenol L-rhamnosyltransferase
MPPIASGLDLSIIIVNWNSTAFLRKCLSSLYANTKSIRLEVIVVDNASGDGCGEMVRKEFPSVNFIQSNQNLGFARANNLGFTHSSGRNILFLNPDTEILGAAIERMVHFLDQTPNTGIVGPKLLNSDHSIQTSCIRSFPTLVNEALDAEFLRQKFPRARLWGTSPLYADASAPVAVDAVSGAALMVRREAFEKAGLFTAAYFMYAEDMDLCFKVRQAGRTNYFVPDATILHHGGQSTESRDDRNFADVVMRESRLRFFRNRMGALYAAGYKATTSVVALIRLALLSGLWILPGGPVRRDSARRSLGKWIRIFRWSIGMERWAGRLNQAGSLR